jgi:hypothetical protein
MSMRSFPKNPIRKYHKARRQLKKMKRVLKRNLMKRGKWLKYRT